MNTHTKSNALQAYQAILYNRALHPELFDLRSRNVHPSPSAELETWLVETGPPQAEVAATTDAAASWALAPCSGRSR